MKVKDKRLILGIMSTTISTSLDVPKEPLRDAPLGSRAKRDAPLGSRAKRDAPLGSRAKRDRAQQGKLSKE